MPKEGTKVGEVFPRLWRQQGNPNTKEEKKLARKGEGDRPPGQREVSVETLVGRRVPEGQGGPW